MEAERFDTLTRLIGGRTSRRLAVALAATGLLSLAVPDIAEARCSARKRCPDCKRCKKHRCKPDAGQDGNACSGVSGGTCERGTCCLGLQANCTAAKQCCQKDGAMQCGPIGNLGQDQCCRPLGGACATPGDFNECCTVLVPGNGRLVRCAPGNTCGGTGAMCTDPSTCASGVCCGFDPISKVCCGSGQRCEGFSCVN